MNILLFGPPGAGKGTQSALLKERLNMLHISTGDLFRANIKGQTELGMKAKAIIDRGDLVPDEITIGMVEQEFQKMSGQSFILDGFPRTVAQAEALDRLLATNNMDLGKAIFIDVSHDYLVKRLTGRRVCSDCGATFHVDAMPPKAEGVCDNCGGELKQRKDDHESVISTRLKTYEENTLPVLEYYKKAGKYVEVDGLGETEDVYKRITAELA
ncbi:MAG: adenylate kinase [Bdellovibrionota bacterium]|nr:adenylate kinase [Bdellovibrionota bacterium]